jgi:energy-coupling factor transport system ATP-binding protein
LWRGRGLVLERRDPRGAVELFGGLDFEIRAGEFRVVVGPNGSGKSTLLELLAGLLVPTGGRIERSAALGGAATPPGFLAQFPEYQLFAPTVREELEFGPRHRRGPRPAAGERRARVHAALLQAGFDPVRVLEQSPEALSLGERRRLALAAVLVSEPVVLLLDEPMAGLDDAARAGLREILAAAHARGSTVVVATHDPAAPAEWGARALALPLPRRPAQAVTVGGRKAVRREIA